VTDVDLAWLAGILEGEGTFLKRAPSAPKLKLTQARQIRDRFASRESAVSLAEEYSAAKWLIHRIKGGKRAY
jgi:hypothetical protein